MNINFRIKKNSMVDKFLDYMDEFTDSKDRYISKGKEVQFRREYYILQKIKDIYLFVIEEIKLDIRKEFIHSDKNYKEAMNILMNRVNNKIRSNSNGKLFLDIGSDKKIRFNGDDDQYKEYIISNKNKRKEVIKKIVDEINALLENNIDKEEGRAILNASKVNIKEEEINPVCIINKFLENINSKFIFEIFKGDFSNFDRIFFDFMSEYNIELEKSKKMLENIHSQFIDSEVPINMLNKIIQEADTPKQIYKRFSDPGIENRREKSMDVLKGRGLTAAGGGWHNKRGELVATIGDKGEIQWKNNTLTQPPDGGVGQGISSAGQSIEKGFAQQQPVIEPEIETGLSDKELEYIRKTFHCDVSN